MSFRARLTALAAVAVAVALLVGSIGIYVVTARSLTAPVDQALREFVQGGAGLVRQPLRPAPGRFGEAIGLVQVVDAAGDVAQPRGQEVALPVDERTLAAARSGDDRWFMTVRVDDVPLRVYTVPVADGLVLQVARPIGELEESLANVRRQLLAGAMIGVGLAALLGLAVSRRAVRPVEELTALAEEVARTQDLSRRIETQGDDEIGRLAHTFNGMLANLEQARSSQQQLVADASHELRTPLTSLRTNIEVLADVERLRPDQRRELIDDVVVQLDEFGRLVSGLVELARGDQPATHAAPVRLDELVAVVVERARTFAPAGRELVVRAAPTTVVVERDRVERAVANLVDNAIKYGEGTVEITVADGRVEVRDHGPGIPDADLPHVFDRFYRAASARSAPGSGLGLSIVAQAAAAHGGAATADNAPDGGAVTTLEFPPMPPA